MKFFQTNRANRVGGNAEEIGKTPIACDHLIVLVEHHESIKADIGRRGQPSDLLAQVTQRTFGNLHGGGFLAHLVCFLTE